MARVFVKPTRGARLRLTARMERIVKDPQLLEEVKDFSVNRIVQTARQKKRMTDRGTALLPKLSSGYVEQRKKRNRDIDPEFFLRNSDRSNWTLTGQFLKSITGRAIRSGRLRGKVAIFPSGRRKDGIKNIQIYRWLVNDLNPKYEIFKISRPAQKQIAKIFQRFLRRRLRNRRR